MLIWLRVLPEYEIWKWVCMIPNDILFQKDCLIPHEKWEESIQYELQLNTD